VIGLDFVANEFIGKIHLNCNDNGEYMIDGQTYVLNIETINRDNDSFSFDLQSKGKSWVISCQNIIDLTLLFFFPLQKALFVYSQIICRLSIAMKYWINCVWII
jgi:hypothetical protein